MSFFDLVVNFYTVVLVIVVLSVINYKRKYSVWSSRGVVGPTPIPFIGSSLEPFFESFHEVFFKSLKKYGRFYGTYDAFGATLVVNDPKIVNQVCVRDFHLFTNRRVFDDFPEVISKMLLVATDGEWKRERKIISPTFSTGKIKRMKPLIEKCITNAIEELEVIAANQNQLNLKQFWSRFTLEVIACCCFATDVNSHKDPDNEFFKHVTGFFSPPGVARMLVFIFLFLIPAGLRKRLPVTLFPQEHVDYLSQVTRHLLNERKAGDTNHNDFLQLLIEAEKENEDKNEPPLTEVEIIANCMVFLTAGYETTANLLGWVCYLLASNPEAQEKLFEELRSNFGNGKSIDYDVANKLPYLDAVISETLRLYPPLVSTERTAKAEVKLESIGVTIPAKSVVLMSVYAMHRDPEFFPEPELFKPERFLSENREKIAPYTYIPFGTGPRNCVAMRFALIEVKLALIQAILHFRFVRSEKTSEKPKFAKFSPFAICNNIFVRLIKR